MSVQGAGYAESVEALQVLVDGGAVILMHFIWLTEVTGDCGWNAILALLGARAFLARASILLSLALRVRGLAPSRHGERGW